MFKEYIVLSRSKARKLSYCTLENLHVIISITDSAAAPTGFCNENPQLGAILRLAFDDVGKDENGAMSEVDADKIIRFIELWKDKADTLVVHCEAGISRSAGVCGAIMKWCTGSDAAIFGNAAYVPNMHCYRQVINAFIRMAESSSEEQR